MGFKGKNVGAAITLTIFDLLVPLRYGTAVWQAYSEIIWYRPFLLFVAVWVTSLVALWSWVRCASRKTPRPRRVRLTEITPAEETEEGDV